MGVADKSLLSRITSNPQILTGKPVIRDLRIPVDLILELLAKGASSAEILEDYPDLEPTDIQAALLYAYHLVVLEHQVHSISPVTHSSP